MAVVRGGASLREVEAAIAMAVPPTSSPKLHKIRHRKDDNLERERGQVARNCANEGKCAIQRVIALNAKSLAESVTHEFER